MLLCFIKCILHKYKGREDDKKDVGGYWMSLRKRENNCSLEEEALDGRVQRTRLEEDVDPS